MFASTLLFNDSLIPRLVALEDREIVDNRTAIFCLFVLFFLLKCRVQQFGSPKLMIESEDLSGTVGREG